MGIGGTELVVKAQAVEKQRNRVNQAFGIVILTALVAGIALWATGRSPSWGRSILFAGLPVTLITRAAIDEHLGKKVTGSSEKQFYAMNAKYFKNPK